MDPIHVTSNMHQTTIKMETLKIKFGILRFLEILGTDTWKK